VPIAIIVLMRQLLARIDERLHRRLKERAAAEGRSMNSLVTELLAAGVAGQDEGAILDARLDALGLRRVFPPKRRPRSLDAVIRSLRGTGTAASDALAADRARR
jgi:plasmid stability protein